MNKNIKEYGLNKTLDFGKYKNHTIEDIIYSNPSYIEWCVNQGIFSLTYHVQKILETNLKRKKSYSAHYHNDCFRGYSEDDMAELAFCEGLDGGGQGW